MRINLAVLNGERYLVTQLTGQYGNVTDQINPHLSTVPGYFPKHFYWTQGFSWTNCLKNERRIGLIFNDHFFFPLTLTSLSLSPPVSVNWFPASKTPGQQSDREVGVQIT